MPILVQYKIIDGFNEYYDYLIHQDDIDEADEDVSLTYPKEDRDD